MKSTNHNNIFSNTGCIDKDTLIQYSKGTLLGIEKHNVERHLIDCPLCADAAEGYMMYGGNVNVDMINNAIHERINKNKKDYRKLYAVAALIGGFIIISYFLINSLDHYNGNRVAVRNENAEIKKSKDLTEKPQPATIKSGNAVVMQKKQTEVVDKEEIVLQLPVEEKNVSPEAVAEGNTADAVTNTEAPSAVVFSSGINKETADENSNVTYVDNLKVINEPVNQSKKQPETNRDYKSAESGAVSRAEESKDILTVQSAEVATSKYKNRLADGLALYNKERYSAALEIFNELLIHNPDDDNAIFYKGVSLYHLGRFEESISFLKVFTSNMSHPFQQESEYYVALALAGKGDLVKSEIILNNISRNNGTYSNKANNVLKKIKK
jgi:hypothetical protein